MVEMRSQGASLLSLPPEILTAILGEVLASSIDSVRAMLYVCKQLHAIALPLSVHTYYSLQGDRGEGTEAYLRNLTPEVRIDVSVRQPALRRQERNLAFAKYVTVTKPFLAPRVKRIVVSDFLTPRTSIKKYSWLDMRRKLSAVERHTYQEMIRELFASDKLHEYGKLIERVIDELEFSHEEYSIVLLLAACVDLEDFCFGEPHRPGLLQGFIRAAAETARIARGQGLAIDTLPLHNLRNLYHESQDSTFGYQRFVEVAAPFFALPNSRSYECTMVGVTEGSAERFLEIPRHSSTVEHITLRYGCLPKPVLTAMVGACAALRSFEYSSGVEYVLDGEMMPADIMEAMLPHADSLEFLDLNCGPNEQPDWDPEPEKTYLGVKLKRLRALKTLKAGSQLLTGILDGTTQDPNEMPKNAPRLLECLPEDLEHLEIYDCGKKILDQLQELLDALADASSRYNRLRFVRFLFHNRTIQPHEIKLTCNASSVRIEAVIQSKWQERRDRSGCMAKFIPSCTPLYCQSREQWLANLGSGTRVEISGTPHED